MKIKEIALRNLKGVTQSFKFSPTINWIWGDNGTGKTAIMDGINLALTGEHPVWGQRQSSIFSMSSGDSMEATLNTDDGLVYSYQLTRAKSKINKEHVLPVEGKPFTGANAIGLKPSELWVQTPAKLIKDLIELTGYKAEHLKEVLQKCRPVDANTRILMEGIDDLMGRRHLSIESVTEALTEIGRKLGDQIKQLDGKLEGMDVLTEEEPESLKKLKEEESLFIQMKEHLTQSKAKIDSLLDDYLSNHFDVFDTVEELKAGQVEIKKEFLDDINKEKDRLEVLDSELIKLTNESERLKEIGIRLSEAKGNLSGKLDTLETQLSTHEKGGECPTCGQPVDDHEHLAKLEENLQEAKEDLKNCEECSTRNINALKKVSYQIEEKTTEASKIRAWLLKAEQDIKEMESETAQILKAYDECRKYNVSMAASEEVEDKLNSTSEALEEIRARMRVAERIQSTLAAKEATELSRIETLADLEALKEIQKSFAKTKAEMVESLIMGLVDDANTLLKGSYLKLEYSEELGLCSTKGVPLKGLSGAEYALAATALTAAIGSDFIFLDEIDRLDATNKQTLVENLIRIEQGQKSFPQVFLLGVSEPPKSVAHLITTIERTP